MAQNKVKIQDVSSSTGTGAFVFGTAPTIQTSLTASFATASTIAIFDGSKNLISAATATYPDLTELSYLKGVTSSIQTQLNGKQASGSYATTALDNLASVAINTTLVSDTNNTDDLGTTSIAWRTGYFATSIFNPLLVGGSAVGSSLSLKSTSAVGTTDSIKFLVGNNGGTEALRILNAGSSDFGPNGLLFGSAIGTSDLRLIRSGANSLTFDRNGSGAITLALGSSDGTLRTGSVADNGNNLTIKTISTSRDIIFSPNSVEAMRIIQSSNNVAIGTSGAAARLLTLTRSTDGIEAIQLTNSNAGTGAYSALLMGSSAGTNYWYNFGGGYTTSGRFIQASSLIESNTTGGLSFAASDATGIIRFYTNADNLRWTINASGHFLTGTDNTYDIGASGATRPRTGYFGTSIVAPSATHSSLTAGRVTFAGTGGLLTDDADFTFATDTLTVTKIAATTFTGNITTSTVNLVTDTTTGTKIGTATNQKLGFFNATPIVQPTGDIVTALQNLGLVSLGTVTASHVGLTWVAGSTSETTTTSTSAADILTFSGLSIAAGTRIRIVGKYRKTNGAAAAFNIGLKVNATVVLEAGTGDQLGATNATNEAQTGVFEMEFEVGESNYQSNATWSYVTYTSSAGAGVVSGGSGQAGASNLNALIPSATVTSIIIRGKVGSASITGAVKDIQIYTYGTS